MSEQALDLRRAAQILRRHKVLVGIVVILGALAGGVYAAANPPTLTSTALVILPQSEQAQQGAAVIIDGAADPYTLTQQVIMTSNAVLRDALPHVRPATSVDKLRRDISVGILTPYVISVSAKGQVASDELERRLRRIGQTAPGLAVEIAEGWKTGLDQPPEVRREQQRADERR